MVTEVTALHQAADRYADTFAGQRSAYSYWNGRHWQTAYDWNETGTPVTQRPLTPEVVINAFTTGIPISGYLLAPDNTTHVACLDIDREDGFLLAQAAGRRLRDLGGTSYVERSRRGAHLWAILSEPRPAILVRRALTALVKEGLGPDRICPGSGHHTQPHGSTGRPMCPSCRKAETGARTSMHRDPRIEFRPASDRLPQAGDGNPKLGHCIRLPTMPHHKTGKRYQMISVSTGEVLDPKLVPMMDAIERCDVEVFEELAQRAPLPKVSVFPADLSFPHGRPEVTQTASEILQQLWGVANAQPGKVVHCPAHDDQIPSLSISRDDERAWCHSPTCELHNDGHGRGTYELTQMAPRMANAV